MKENIFLHQTYREKKATDVATVPACGLFCHDDWSGIIVACLGLR